MQGGVAPSPSQGPLGGVLVQLAAALLQAEHWGLVHLDLKQDNVWLGEDGVLHLLDWGMCSRIGLPLRLMYGTVPSMPLEMLDEHASAKCKVFTSKQDW